MTTLRRSIRPAAALAAPALALLLFTGCSGVPSSLPSDASATPDSSPAPGAEADDDAGQSTAEACDVLAAGLERLGQVDASNIQDDLVNDPEAALATIDEAQAAILDATGSVTNEELRPFAEDAAEATRQYFGVVRAAAENPASADVEAIQADLSTFTGALVELQTACSGG